MNLFHKILAAHVVAVIITFGHAYTTSDKTRQFIGQEIQISKAQRAGDAIMCAVWWPLYVSILAWE